MDLKFSTLHPTLPNHQTTKTPMTTLDEDEWITEYWATCFYHWGGPCGDDADRYMSHEAIDKECVEYFKRLYDNPDSGIAEGKWDSTIDEFVKDYNKVFSPEVITREQAVSIFMAEIEEFLL